MIKNKTKEEVNKILTDILNDCLSSANQEYSFKVDKVDLENEKFQVTFNIVQVEDDNYIGFQGY
jgi:hypothetical protein